jgi:exopolyphosphatase/guanosine-5'-triphosphate,3'-diphosphate pyrophosphatase
LGALARRDDPLLASAEQIAVRFGRFASLGLPLADWTDQLFADEPPQETRLRHAVCLLSDLGWIDHPDHRAIHGFSRLLTLPVQGLDHPGRAYLAHAIHARFGGATDDGHLAVAEHAGLEPDALARARALGAALRLGFSISAGRADFLRATFIKRDGGHLVLHLPEASGTYSGDALASQHGSLAKMLGLKPRVDIAGQDTDGGADEGANDTGT